MPKHRDEDHKGAHGSGGDGKREREREHDEGNAAHIEIEERRFRGGLAPTPELYARARAQWNRLPGSLARSAQDPATGKPPGDPKDKPAGEAGTDGDKEEGS